jgi:PAS domain S-box-containing protein
VVESGSLVFILALAGVGFSILRRPEAGPTAFWTWGCFALFGSGLCTFILAEFRWSLPVGHALATAYPVFLLAGALVYAERDMPRWLLPGALALGFGRGLLAMVGLDDLSHGIALVVEPTAALAGAAYVFGATRDGGASAWQRALAPALVLMAGMDAASALWMIGRGAMPVGLVGAWLFAVPLVLALQIAAVSDRSQDALRRARDELGRRVEERTAELAKSVAELEAQIDERRAAEQALRESEERYRTLSELSSDFSFAVRLDRDRRVQFEWASDAIRRVTGYGVEELDGGAWFSLTHPEDREEAFARLDAILAGEARDMEMRIVTKKEGMRRIHLVANTLRSEEDGNVRIVGAGRDITEHKLAQEEQRRLDLHMREVQRLESLGLLAGGVAHDFNNMLSVIRGNIRLARADLQSGASPSRRLDRIQSAQEHASALTEQVLTYAGKASVKLRPLDLSQLTRDMLGLLQASMMEKESLELDLAEDLPAIEGDVTQIRQVILNLLTNASEALGEGDGKVRVRTRLLVADARLLSDSFGTPEPAAGEYVALEVSDTGEGMDPALNARIFEPFFTTKPSGSGLGLAAVLGIVSAHRGVVRVAGEPGGGTLFQVLIPRSAGRAESVHPGRRRRAGGARARAGVSRALRLRGSDRAGGKQRDRDLPGPQRRGRCGRARRGDVGGRLGGGIPGDPAHPSRCPSDLDQRVRQGECAGRLRRRRHLGLPPQALRARGSRPERPQCHGLRSLGGCARALPGDWNAVAELNTLGCQSGRAGTRSGAAAAPQPSRRSQCVSRSRSRCATPVTTRRWPWRPRRQGGPPS